MASGPGTTVTTASTSGSGTVVTAHHRRRSTEGTRRRQRAQDVGRAAAGRYSHHRIGGADLVGRDVVFPAGEVVLDSLPREENSVAAAGNHTHHHPGIDAKRGRTLRGVDNAEPTARAGPEIEQPAAPPERGDGQFHDPGDIGQRPADGVGDETVLVVDQPHDFFGAGEVDPHGPGIPLLRRQVLYFVVQSVVFFHEFPGGGPVVPGPSLAKRVCL